MSGIAGYEAHQRKILRWLRRGRIERAYWFIHEDKAQLPAVAPSFTDVSFCRELRGLIATGRLRVLVPSHRLKVQYDELFNTDLVKTVPPRLKIAESFKRARSIDEYHVINFLLSGQTADGQDGQLTVIFAFQELMKRYVDRSPTLYREFSLTLTGIGDDYISEQVRTIGVSVLGKRLKIFPRVTHDAALKLTSQCNVVICCPLNAGFPHYVAEGMAMGHVVLRNDTGGKEEQLREGVNGYFIDSSDIGQMAQVIELILNRDRSSDSTLQAMGYASQEISERYEGFYLEHFARD
jgi:glycosyltransferase involved in cell wall biosynthesis